MSEPKLDDLMRELSSGSEEERRFAAEDLGDFGDPAAVQGLAAALRDRCVAVREAAADALISIGGEPVCQAMVPLLDDDDAVVRNLALEVFERLRTKAISACIQLYALPSHDLRKIAVDTLGKIEEARGTKGFEILISALDDPHVNVASAACEALGRLGGKKAVKALSGFVGRHPWMDSTIFLSLARIGTQDAKEALIEVKEKKLQPEAAYALQAAKDMMGV